jgi:hypothetical protein
VAICPSNPRRPDPYGTDAQFEDGQRQRRQRMMNDYLRTLQPQDFRGLVIEAVRRDAEDLGLQMPQ